MKRKKSRRTIRRKVRTGFIILGTILFFSSVIAIFEFVRINRASSGVINDNILSINAERSLMESSELYNMELFEMLDEDIPPKDFSTSIHDSFVSTLEALPDNFTTEKENSYADSVRYAYSAYMQVVMEAPEIWEQGPEARQDWYFGRAQQYFSYLRNYINDLNAITNEALQANSEMMESTFFRSMMPSVAALLVGLIVILLFNAFLTFYVIKPITKMGKGVKDFVRFGKDYNITFDGDDEISDLNDTLTDLIDEHKTLKNR
ncbi:MAG: hypothetical protein IKN88_04125 [Bacteroidales bacterium]|nr:hypothetical protein [Bacteroidales bacterium]